MKLGQRFQSHMECLESRRLLAATLLLDAAGISATESLTIGGTSYFFANNGTAGQELWKSDGTTAGTTLVKDITPGASGTELLAMFHGADDRAVFITAAHRPAVNDHAADDYTLWASDGTAGGTVKLKEFSGSISLVTHQLGDQVVVVQHVESSTIPRVQGNTYVDAHLFVTSGTSASTKEIKTFLATAPTETVPSVGYTSTNLFDAGSRLVFGIGDYQHLWSTDGTAPGTTNISSSSLTDAIDHFQINLQNMVQLEGGKVLIPSAVSAGTFWISDGTAAGTKSTTVAVNGSILPGNDSNAVLEGKYIFIEQFTPSDGNHETGPQQKIVHALDIATGQLTTLYTTTGDGSLHQILLHKAGSRIIFNDIDRSDYSTSLWTTDATASGTIKLGQFTNYTRLYNFTDVGASFFVMAKGPFTPGLSMTDAPTLGWIGGGADDKLREVVGAGTAELELWRTDGTAANTGMVKSIWKGDANGLIVAAGLAEADGKLVMHTEIHNGIDRVHFPVDLSVYPTLYDDTSAYDDKELTFGRQGATARLVNGVLKIGGSLADDRIRIWRSQRMPDRLVVEYNGNERSFNFASISRITADLQDGNDYFEILEGEGQIIRTRTSILGGDGADTIIGATGRDTIYGGNSGDLIYGRGNGDVIIGGGGKDRINAGAGDDQIAGGSGYDRVTAGGGVDVLFGQSAIEMAFGRDVEGDQTLEDVLLA